MAPTSLPARRERLWGAMAMGTFFALVVASCVTVTWREPVASFGETVTTASRALGSYYVQMNDFERRVYLDEHLYQPSLAVEWAHDGHPTPLASQAFSSKSIKARLDALELIALWAQRLEELAQADAPAAAADAGTLLGQNLADLSQTMAGLAGDKSAPSYAGPVSAIFGALSEMWVEHRRDAAIKAGIEKGAPAIRQVLELLEDDMVAVVQPLRETGAKELIAERVGWYNSQRLLKGVSFDDRRAALMDIDEAVRTHVALVAFSPTGITQALRQALNALVRLAASKRTTTDLEQFDTVMRAVHAQVSGCAQLVTRISARE
jgi:hypothetical protein